MKPEKQKTLAIFSPSQNAYSETFIQAHKKLPFRIKYYYGGYLPTHLENGRSLSAFSFMERARFKLVKKFSLAEQALMYSLKREKVDCILAEYGPTACATLSIAKHLQVPLIAHFHGYDATNPVTIKEYVEQYKKLFGYASAIVAVSAKMKKDLATLGCPEEKIAVTACGPNNEFLTLKPAYTTPQFIAVGRLVDIKAPMITIAAFKKAAEKFPAAILIMVGDGPLLLTCKQFAKLSGLCGRVIFKGILSPAEIREEIEGSVAFLQHSITLEGGISEGTPVSVLEAQAAALPVIATRSGGIPEVVIHNETGLLVNEHDVDGMAESIMRILSEEGLAQKLGDAGRARIKENFTINKHLHVLEKLVENAIVKVSNVE